LDRSLHLGGGVDLDRAEFTDCTLVLTDGRKLPAHRVILSAGSRVFAATWSGGLLEARLDGDPGAAESLVRHLYGQPVEVSVAQLGELLRLADMYGVKTLVDAIRQWLGRNPLTSGAAAAVYPAVRTLELVGANLAVQALRMPTELEVSVHFLRDWSWDDVAALVTSSLATDAVNAFKVATMWAKHEPVARTPMLGAMLDGVPYVVGPDRKRAREDGAETSDP
jgi:hypothetical protein